MDLGLITNLGVAGFAIFVLWKQSQSNAEKDKRHEEQMAAMYESFQELNHDIRNKLSTQLMENTNAMGENTKMMGENTKVMERVLDLLSSLRRK